MVFLDDATGQRQTEAPATLLRGESRREDILDVLLADALTVVLYLDGVEKARKAVSGPITYTANPQSRAFCIGSDISGRGTGEFFFPGSIAYARIDSWALTPTQVKAISNE